MAYKGSLVELLLFGTYWVYEHVYRQLPYNPIKNVMYINLLASKH